MVWLTGQRHNYLFLLNIASGKARRVITQESYVDSGGLGRPVGSGLFLAVYADPQSRELMLQAGKRRLPLDGVTAIWRKRAGGLWSILRLYREGELQLQVRQRTLGRFVMQVADITYDYLDETEDDFLMYLGYLINSPQGRANFLEKNDPMTGPWELLS